VTEACSVAQVSTRTPCSVRAPWVSETPKTECIRVGTIVTRALGPWSKLCAALWLTHSAAPQFEQSTKNLLTAISSKSLGFRKRWPRCLDLNAVNALQSQDTWEAVSNVCLQTYIAGGAVYQPQFEQSGTPNVQSRFLWGSPDFITFFWHMVIFWIPVIRGVTSLIGGGGVDYRVMGLTPTDHHVTKSADHYFFTRDTPFLSNYADTSCIPPATAQSIYSPSPSYLDVVPLRRAVPERQQEVTVNMPNHAMSPRKVDRVEQKRFRLKFETEPWQGYRDLGLSCFITDAQCKHWEITQISAKTAYIHTLFNPPVTSPFDAIYRQKHCSVASWILGKPNRVSIWSTIHLYTMVCSWNQNPTQWNLIGHSTTGPPPVLSPSINLLPQSSHGACLSAKKNFGAGFKNVILFYIFKTECMKLP